MEREEDKWKGGRKEGRKEERKKKGGNKKERRVIGSRLVILSKGKNYRVMTERWHDEPRPPHLTTSNPPTPSLTMSNLYPVHRSPLTPEMAPCCSARPNLTRPCQRRAQTVASMTWMIPPIATSLPNTRQRTPSPRWSATSSRPTN